MKAEEKKRAQRREALYITTMLPDRREDALAVLHHVRELLDWQEDVIARPRDTVVKLLSPAEV